nr:zinc finger, CCHC-type, retrotransposon Gag domain protein [Tanacetum cinerariifolium]
HHNDWDTSVQRSESSSSITSSSDPEIVALKAEMAEINKNLIKVLQINQQVKAVTHNCETYGGPHSYNDCPSTIGQTKNVYAARAYNQGEIREEFRTSSGPSDAGGNPPPVTIHTWFERFNKQKPHSFEKATAPVDAENWISYMEKIFDVMGCEDAFKTRLAVYKFEGNALAWWKAYKQAKGGDAWLITVTWADFKKLFFLQFFPRAEQERLKREYHFIRQTNTETSTEFIQRFVRLAGFLGAAAGTEEEQAKNFQRGLHRSTLNHLMCMSYTDVA